jgi:hypothetical protein
MLTFEQIGFFFYLLKLISFFDGSFGFKTPRFPFTKKALRGGRSHFNLSTLTWMVVAMVVVVVMMMMTMMTMMMISLRLVILLV